MSKARFEVRAINPARSGYGIWDTKKNYFLPNSSANGPWNVKEWAIAVIACDLINALPKTALDSGEYDGGESWMEEFSSRADISTPESQSNKAVLYHEHCEEFMLEYSTMNLRQQLQAAYEHLEECGK